MAKVIRFPQLTALEFFSGIGLARAGMEEAGVRTIWANDVDKTKCDLYSSKWTAEDLHNKNVFDVDADTVPHADIAWASSPCTDLSLAGKRGGLAEGRESSAFFGFTKVIEKMGPRKPEALILENVCGLASSHEGNDFRAVVETFNGMGYSVDAFELNSRRWLPQSRPRMFVVGLLHPIDGGAMDSCLRPDRLSWIHVDPALITHLTPLPSAPELLGGGLTGLVDKLSDDDPRWWDKARIEAFVNSLSAVQAKRLECLKSAETVQARTAYRRTRKGKPVWEMREDDISGGLRTTRGGSSKQAVVFLGNEEIRIRWMTGSEYAKLQGAKGYDFSEFRESQVQYAFGDAVSVPVVEWLVRNAVIPALNKTRCDSRAGLANAV